MDVPPALTWTELKELASNRDGWRRRVHDLRHGAAGGASIGASIGVSITMNNSLPGCKVTRSRPLPPATTSAPTASPRARKYLSRDAQEAFFRPREKGKRKRSLRQPATKKRRKDPLWTNKQRQTWTREHFEQNHGNRDSNGDLWSEAATPPSPSQDSSLWAEAAIPPSDTDMDTSEESVPPPTPTTPLTPTPSWSPQILGHRNDTGNDNDHTLDATLPITPTRHMDMFRYWEDLSRDHSNLRNLSKFEF